MDSRGEIGALIEMLAYLIRVEPHPAVRAALGGAARPLVDAQGLAAALSAARSEEG